MLKDIKLSDRAQDLMSEINKAEERGCQELHMYIRNMQVRLATFLGDYLTNEEIIFFNEIKDKLNRGNDLTPTEKIIIAMELEEKIFYRERTN